MVHPANQKGWATDHPVNGTVKWYNPEKAYGFITVASGEDIFVHRSVIADGRDWLVDGQVVSLVVRQGVKGPEAADVRVVQDVAGAPPWRESAYRRAAGMASAGAPRRPREPYRGVVPSGPAAAIVQRIDPAGRFLFVRLEEADLDVYVHRTVVDQAGVSLREGDRVEVIVEQSERGPRARTLRLR